jgi:hypothetical protein
LKEIVIPDPKPLVFKPVKLDIPKFEDPLKKPKTRSAVLASQTNAPENMNEHKGEPGVWTLMGGEWIFYSDRQVTVRKKPKQKESLVPEEPKDEYEWVGTNVKTRRYVKKKKVEPLDTAQVTSMVPETGTALVAGQMEANALATAGATPSITDASSSTVVNNSNQSMMMPLPDPNPHNMDFRVEERLFPS